jgi:RsiW-degrading membrane proteinase PrsW (M82 family)
MAGAARVEDAVFGALVAPTPLGLAGAAALVEESAKLLVVAGFALFARRIFNDPMDGLIYGSLAGLGAALEEAVAVLRATPRAGALLPPEELVRLCGHLVFGGIAGFGVGAARLRLFRWPRALAGGFVGASALHFGWDVIALRAEMAPLGPRREPLFAAGWMLLGLLLYGRLVVVASAWSQAIFSPGVARRLGG